MPPKLLFSTASSGVAMKTAKLLVELPESRYRIQSRKGRAPCVGDVLALDQGFTDNDGLPMVLAYFPSVGSNCLYDAEVYESELE